MRQVILEIRSAEGGEDSKLLVEDMLGIYLKTAKNNNFSAEVLEQRSGYASVCL